MSETIARPTIKSGCYRCKVTPEEVASGYVLVSPTGKAHHSREYYGETECGIDATGENWWWPL
jgi:hypothetical protein